MKKHRMTTVQNLELGRQDEVWHRGQKVVKVELTEHRSYPYRLTYSDGHQDFMDAAEIVTYRG